MSISSTSSTLITTNHNHHNQNHNSVKTAIMTHQDCEDDCISYDASSCSTGKISQISGTSMTSRNTNNTRSATPAVDNNNTESNDAKNRQAMSRPSSSTSTKSEQSQSSMQSKSLIRAMSSESLRRETKLKNMKQRKERKDKKEDNETQQQHSKSSTLLRKNNHNNPMNQRRYNSMSPPKRRGIMAVRTLQESLATADCHHSKTILHNQRKRKRLQKRMEGIIRNVNVTSDTDNDTGTPSSPPTPNRNNTVTSTAAGGTSHDEELPSLFSYLTTSTSSTSSSANHSHESNQSILSSDKFNVSYSNITIRDYPIIPGDNPTVSSGPPITIDWNYITEVSTDINTFESIRHNKRRLQSEMKMPDTIRLSLLLNSGYKMNELRKSTRQAALIKKYRIQSIDNIHKDEWMEKMEERRNGIWNVMNIMRKHRKKEEEDRLLEQYEGYYHNMTATTGNSNIDIHNNDDEKDHELDNTMTMQRSRIYNKAVTFLDEGKNDVNIIYDDITANNSNGGDTTITLRTHIPTAATVGATTSTTTALKDNHYDNDNHGIDKADDSHDNDEEDQEEMIVSNLKSLYVLPQQGEENGKVEGGVSFLSLFRFCMDTGDGTGTSNGMNM